MWNIEKWNHSKYILNLSQIKYMNSKSIWYISSMYEFITDNQKMMHLVSDNKELTEILDMVWMKWYIPFYTTNEESIKEMKS
jgi:anti-anti-sigma factor